MDPMISLELGDGSTEEPSLARVPLQLLHAAIADRFVRCTPKTSLRRFKYGSEDLIRQCMAPPTTPPAGEPSLAPFVAMR